MAGLPRTATTSIKAALEQLGFEKCYHHIDPLMQFNHISKLVYPSKRAYVSSIGIVRI
jgi:hypothetical protein